MMAEAAIFLLLFGCSSYPGLLTEQINQRPIIVVLTECGDAGVGLGWTNVRSLTTPGYSPTVLFEITSFRSPAPSSGILAQETLDAVLLPYGKTYIAAPYVKYLESAGCRVVPIRLNLTHEEYERIFHSINGILFPGGAANLKTSAFARVAKTFYKLALKAFDAGDYFPIWGTCLGLQLLTLLTAGKDLLTNTDTENIALPLNLTNAAASSKMFQNFPLDVYKALSTEPLTGNFHHFSISVQAFLEDEKLSEFYSILSTNNDREGVEFVSTVEGIQYPFYGVQWHPEVNRFQWRQHIAFPHSPNAVQVSYLLANFFVNEARKNFHHFPSSEEEAAALIYNYSPRYVPTSSYIQVYFF